MNYEQRMEAQAKINYVQSQLGRLFGEDTSFGQIDNHEAPRPDGAGAAPTRPSLLGDLGGRR